MPILLDNKKIKLLLDRGVTPEIRQQLERVLKPKNPRYGKAKGARFQMEICRDVAQLLGTSFDNQDDVSDIHSRGMGQHGTDIIVTGNHRELFPWEIECKSTQTLPLKGAIEQVVKNTPDGRKPLILWKYAGHGVYAVLKWVDLQELMQGSINEKKA